MGSVAGAAIGAAGSIIGGGKSSKKAAKAQAASEAAQLRLAQLQNQWGRENAQWAVDTNRQTTWENQDRIDRQTRANRPNQSSDFGNISWVEGDNGIWSQTASLDPATKAMLGTLRGKQGEMIGGLETGFDVDNSVMGAMRGLQAPELQERRDAENARLAAMGLSTGSGSAWETAQRGINDAESRADLQAILAGNNAWLQSQQNMRSNLAGLNATETGWNTNLNARPGFANAGVAQQGMTGGTSTPNLGNVTQTAANAGNAAGQATGDSWANASQGLGNLVGSAWDAWNKPKVVPDTSYNNGWDA